MSHEPLDLDRLRVPSLIEAFAFWSAIILPFVYLPLLIIGLDTLVQQGLFVGLIVLNVVMIVLGHRHHQP